MSPAESLYRLQEIEVNIVRSRKRVTEIAAALASSETVNAARTNVESAEKTLQPLLTRARDIDLEMQSARKKAQDTEQHLYSGLVKNPKEMREMQQEIDALNRRHAELETHLLETMMAAEEAEGTLQTAQAALAQVTTAWESDHQQLLDEKRTLEAQVAQMLDRRRGMLGGIAPDALKVYETLKPKKGGQPVALLNGSTCMMCGVGQTMAIEREVRQGQSLVYCANCGRILVQKI
jgi:hypothetical protein